MGYYERRIMVTGVRSAHNSLQDKLDQTKWEWLGERIRALVDDPQFESLRIEVMGPNDD